MRKVLYLLGELEDTDLQWLLDAGVSTPVAAGTAIIRENEPLDDFFIVADGQFSVSKGEHLVAQLGSGEVVGDMSLLDSRPPTATVTAAVDSTVFAIPQGSLRSKLKSDASFAARLYRALSLFLANRLSRTQAMGGEVQAGAAQADQDEDEISPDQLEQLSLAGARFDWFLKRISQGGGT